MGIFSKRFSKPSFGDFPESYFLNNSLKILWANERILESGFFALAPDPYGDEDALERFSTLLGANSHTYVAITPWRLIEGYLANGNFTSYRRKNIEEQVTKKRGRNLYTYTDHQLKQSGSPTSRSTYRVSADFASVVGQSGDISSPLSNEQTVFDKYKEHWGQGPLAELARSKSGQDYLFMAVCKKCSNKQMLETQSLNDETFFPKICRSCLRVNE